MLDGKHASEFAPVDALTDGSVKKIGTSTVGSSTLPVYINAGTPTTVDTLAEAYLSWGGKNISGSLSPVDVAASERHACNRFAFANPAGITTEYSRDGGATWVNYPLTNDQKIALVTTEQNLSVGGGTYYGAITTNCKARITLSAGAMGVYTRMRKLLINLSTSGAANCSILVETSTIGNPTTFTTYATYSVSGWSGWNSLPVNITFGGVSSQTSQIHSIRLTLSIGTANTWASNEASIISIICIGDTYWNTPSTLARIGHVYNYDVSQNVTFPAKVTAARFITKNGTASQYVKGDGSLGTLSNATTSADGLMTSTDKTKLDSIATGAEVNQNAFSKIVVPTAELNAKSKTDTINILPGNNVSITASSNSSAISISSSTPVATTSAIGGIQLGYTASGKNYPIQLSGNKAYVNVPWTDTTYPLANQVQNGLMSVQYCLWINNRQWLENINNRTVDLDNYNGSQLISFLSLINQGYNSFPIYFTGYCDDYGEDMDDLVPGPWSIVTSDDNTEGIQCCVTQIQRNYNRIYVRQYTLYPDGLLVDAKIIT